MEMQQLGQKPELIPDASTAGGNYPDTLLHQPSDLIFDKGIIFRLYKELVEPSKELKMGK